MKIDVAAQTGLSGFLSRLCGTANGNSCAILIDGGSAAAFHYQAIHLHAVENCHFIRMWF